MMKNNDHIKRILHKKILKKTVVVFLAVLVFLSCKDKKDNLVIIEINSNLTFQEVNGTNSGTAKVPGTIHTDLIDNKLIEDPFYRTNEKKYSG